MLSCVESKQGRSPGRLPPATHETLHLLSLVLKAAFRGHCTGEAVCDRGPWQLVREVQNKLLELSQESEAAVSEERLVRYIEAVLAEQPGPVTRPAALVEVN
ncbi:MAG TPA: hypothetical protein VG013_13380 [Gemmataceae bacterium]|jgi:hypothetical protein|nr:hypothetical protein [Gemmataceae bacterium]